MVRFNKAIKISNKKHTKTTDQINLSFSKNDRVKLINSNDVSNIRYSAGKNFLPPLNYHNSRLKYSIDTIPYSNFQLMNIFGDRLSKKSNFIVSRALLCTKAVVNESVSNENPSDLHSPDLANDATSITTENITTNDSPAFGENEKVLQFKTETQKLLYIVAHSLYTDKEIFIRELISNASDALEKLRFLQTTGQAGNILDEDTPLKISVFVDPKSKTITIQDTGIGMTESEIVENLGTIAKSGSLEFLQKTNISSNDAASTIIGQFGVGFYSSFVVANKVEVFTRSYDLQNSSCGYYWVSDGSGSFRIREVHGISRGTKIVCHLKDDSLEFSNFHTAKQCAEKFSSFVSFPLELKDNDKAEIINKQEALWLKSSATDEEHLAFFRHLNNASWGAPMYTLMYKSDAPLSIRSVFYIPEEAPSRLFQSKTEVGVSLHSRRILIKKSAEDIVPKWLFFVKGIVDCEDLPLNVSRENMQDTRLIEMLSETIIKKLLRFLDDEANTNPEKYKKFYNQYSYHLKEGLLDDVQKSGKYKNNILALIRYESSETEAKEWISLEKYLETMKPNQKNIYYFCASDRQTALASPYMEDFKRRNRNVLLMYDDIDEFVAMNLQNYKEKKFVSVDSPDGDFEPLLESAEELGADSKPNKSTLIGAQQNELGDFIKSVLGEKVTAVKFSDRLVDSPAVVSGFLSATLRKMMKATMKGAADAQTSLANLPATLELNPSHPLITYLYHLKNNNLSVAKVLSEQLYDNACVAAGILDDPRKMLQRLTNIMEMTCQYAYHYHTKRDETSNSDVSSTVENSQNFEKIDHEKLSVDSEAVEIPGKSFLNHSVPPSDDSNTYEQTQLKCASTDQSKQ